MDGWNEDRLEGLLSVLGDAYDMMYEIKNCVRGCNTGAHTYEELQQKVNELADRIHNEAEWMNTEEDEEED